MEHAKDTQSQPCVIQAAVVTFKPCWPEVCARLLCMILQAAKVGLGGETLFLLHASGNGCQACQFVVAKYIVCCMAVLVAKVVHHQQIWVERPCYCCMHLATAGKHVRLLPMLLLWLLLLHALSNGW